MNSGSEPSQTGGSRPSGGLAAVRSKAETLIVRVLVAWGQRVGNRTAAGGSRSDARWTFDTLGCLAQTILMLAPTAVAIGVASIWVTPGHW